MAPGRGGNVRLIDLTHAIESSMPVFAGYPKPSLVPWTTHEAHGYAAEAAFMITHCGTHVDAPWHFEKRGRRIDEVPASQLFCKAAVLDCRRPGPAGIIGPRALREAEKSCSQDSPRGSAALLVTGHARRWGRRDYLVSYPGLSAAGARYLRRRGYGAVGVDSPNLDAPEATGFPAHHALLGAGVVIVENLANLEALLLQRRRRITLVALPLKLRGASGSPVRAVALVG